MNIKQGPSPVMELLAGLFRQETSSGTKIVYRWSSGTGGLSEKIFEILLFVGGLAVAVLSFTGILQMGEGTVSVYAVLMPVFFFLPGLLLAYRGFALGVNRSVFEMNGTKLKVHHGPLPFPGATRLDLNSADISSVEWQKIGHVSRAGNASGRVSSGYSATFNVVLKTNAGKTITLLSGLRAREYAFAIAGELTRLLKK